MAKRLVVNPGHWVEMTSSDFDEAAFCLAACCMSDTVVPSWVQVEFITSAVSCLVCPPAMAMLLLLLLLLHAREGKHMMA